MIEERSPVVESEQTEGDNPLHKRSVVDRRTGLDRRGMKELTGLESGRGAGKRLDDFTKSAEEGSMNDEQFLFIQAIEAFKRVNKRSFPTWTEVLSVIRKLGYRKTCKSELNLPNISDWTEEPNAPAMKEK
jgi:hypothetical protein